MRLGGEKKLVGSMGRARGLPREKWGEEKARRKS